MKWSELQKSNGIVYYGDEIPDRKPNEGFRYILGTSGKKPLVVFGINPSTADAEKSDPTIGVIKNLVTKGPASNCGYDSFLMLNVYPARATDPKALKIIGFNPEYRDENLKVIRFIIREFPDSEILAAWGNSIDIKTDIGLQLRLKEILDIVPKDKWVIRGRPTASGNPHHPLRVKREEPLVPVRLDSEGRVSKSLRS